MDVDRFGNLRVDKENNQENWLAFNRAQGARMSAMEHLVPEQMFSTEEAPANGISAVKAIQLAAAEGQKIYTITQQNISIALQQLQLSSEIKADIRNAVSAGMEVTVHTSPVNFFGRPSTGYIVLDPQTGAGAYRIGGGENGGFLDNYDSGFVSAALFGIGLLTLASGGAILPILSLLILVISIFHTIITFMQTDLLLKENGCPENLTGLLASVSAAGFFLPKALRDKFLGLVIAFINFTSKGAVKGAAPLCRSGQ